LLWSAVWLRTVRASDASTGANPAAGRAGVYGLRLRRARAIAYAIAKTYHVAKQRIIAANKLSPPFTLKPGLVLAIPLSAIESSPPSQKTVITKPRPPVAADADVPKRARPKQSPDVIPLD
jgi:hypothetical protein